MKNLCIVVLTFSLILVNAVLTKGFEVDTTKMEAIKYLKILNINSLAVGETGLISVYALRKCLDGAELKIFGDSELETEPSKYSYIFEVIRHPNKEISIFYSDKGKFPDNNEIRDTILSIVNSRECKDKETKGLPLFKVKSFLGANSTSELIENLKKKENTKRTDNGFRTKTSKLESWIVVESKSLIDDSPTVIMTKESENGEQMLIVRCKEGETEAFITTSDYLGDNSRDVIVRFDSEKIKHQNFGLSIDNKALFFPLAIQNIKQMTDSDLLTIRYITSSGKTRTTQFQLTGLKKKIEPLRKACNW